MFTDWIQFAILLVTLIAMALHGERRLTRIETKVNAMWQLFTDAILKSHEQRTHPPDRGHRT